MNNEKMTQSIEDYLEILYNNELKGHGVKITTLAKEMDVKKPSAHQAVAKLKEMGMVTHQTYGMIYLTEKGRKKGADIVKRHKLLYDFLTKVLDVPSESAEIEACGIEHIVSEETIEALTEFLKKYLNQSNN